MRTPPPERPCSATTAAGHPCLAYTQHGESVCYHHNLAMRWRRLGYRHPEDYAIDCWVAGIERRIRERRRYAA